MSAETYTVNVTIGPTPERLGTLVVEGFLGRTWAVDTTMTHDELNSVLSAALRDLATVLVIAKTASAVVSGPAELIVSDTTTDTGHIEVTLNGAGPLAIVSNRHIT